MRDRYNLLTKTFQAKLQSEEKASGIDATNPELDDLLEEILEKEKVAKEKLENNDEEKKNHLRMKRQQRKICASEL